MGRIAVVGLLLAGGACATAGPISPSEAAEVEMEQAQRYEQAEEEERSIEGTNPGDMEGWMPPNAEEDEVMETEPYPK